MCKLANKIDFHRLNQKNHLNKNSQNISLKHKFLKAEKALWVNLKNNKRHRSSRNNLDRCFNYQARIN